MISNKELMQRRSQAIPVALGTYRYAFSLTGAKLVRVWTLARQSGIGFAVEHCGAQ